MKMPMKWHEECLKNFKESVERAYLTAQQAQGNAIRLGEQCRKYEKQIEEAKYRKMGGFDQDRFLKGKL